MIKTATLTIVLIAISGKALQTIPENAYRTLGLSAVMACFMVLIVKYRSVLGSGSATRI